MKTAIITIILLLNAVGDISFSQTLENYLGTAAKNNPGLQATYNEYEIALQKAAQVNTLPDPTLSFGYFISPVETRVGPQRAKFSLSQMFPWFGTLKAQGDAAALMAEAKYQAFLEARNILYYQVASSYYPLWELNRLRQIEKENINILESYKTIALQKYRNGAGTMVDVLRVDIMLNDAQTNLSVLNNKEKALKTSFNKMLNRTADEEVLITDTLSSRIVIPEILKDSVLTNSPILQELDLKYKSAQNAERAAVRQGLPKFGIGLDYVLVDERTDMNLADNGKDVLMPMLSVSIPIFRGKYKAARQEAKLWQQNYLLRKEENRNNLISKYEMVLFEIRQNQDLIKLYDRQIKESKQMLDILFSAYGNSAKEFEEVLRMQQQILKYKNMKVTTISRLHITIEKLYHITAKRR